MGSGFGIAALIVLFLSLGIPVIGNFITLLALVLAAVSAWGGNRVWPIAVAAAGAVKLFFLSPTWMVAIYQDATWMIVTLLFIAAPIATMFLRRGAPASASGDILATLGAAPRPSAPPQAPQSDDVADWDRIANKDDADSLQEYLLRHPNGRFAELARIKLERMGATPLAPPQSPPAAPPPVQPPPPAPPPPPAAAAPPVAPSLGATAPSDPTTRRPLLRSRAMIIAAGVIVLGAIALAVVYGVHAARNIFTPAVPENSASTADPSSPPDAPPTPEPSTRTETEPPPAPSASDVESDARTFEHPEAGAFLESLGVRVRTTQPEEWRCGADQPRTGLIVEALDRGGVLDRNGVREGDLIEQANGAPLNSAEDLVNAVQSVRNGERRALLLLVRQASSCAPRYLAIDLA